MDEKPVPRSTTKILQLYSKPTFLINYQIIPMDQPKVLLNIKTYKISKVSPINLSWEKWWLLTSVPGLISDMLSLSCPSTDSTLQPLITHAWRTSLDRFEPLRTGVSSTTIGTIYANPSQIYQYQWFLLLVSNNHNTQKTQPDGI